MLLSNNRRLTGMTLVEVLTAIGISAICLGSVFAINGSAMTELKMSREAASASQVLQQRIETLRIGNWQEMTDPNCTWLTANAFTVTTGDGSALLKNETETLTLEPYGSSTTGSMVLTKGGTPTPQNTLSSPLLSENAVKVTWVLTFTGAPGDRAVSRRTVAILAKGGVAK